nr:carcinoembryonic antigen-related cell adhesion molecule 21-like isoform X3 [Pogona vitticeps]
MRTWAADSWAIAVNGISWLILLLAAHALGASIFLSLTEKIPANTTIEVTRSPEYPQEGQDVILIPEGKFDDKVSCLWFRGGRERYLEILVYQLKPTIAIHYKPGYNGRQTPDDDCSLHFANVSFEDMALYGVLIERKGNRIEYGERFLLVQEATPEPTEPKESKVLSLRTIAGIVMGCLIGSVLVVGLISYQSFESAGRLEPTWTMRLSSEALTLSQDRQQRLNQLKLSMQNIGQEIGSQENLSPQNIMPG